MTGIRYLSPTTYIWATRPVTNPHAHHALRAPGAGRMRLILRRLAGLARVPTVPGLPRWVDATPTSAGR